MLEITSMAERISAFPMSPGLAEPAGLDGRGNEARNLSRFCEEFGTKRTCSLRSETFCLIGNESQK
jgi:hypothetical protein